MDQTCKLCLVGKDIQKSHAIADSIFKKLFRANSGKAITFSRSEDNISYSSDSWWEHQLCSNCEKHLNVSYEQYSLQTLRGHKGVFRRTENGLTFSEVNLHKLNMFFLSIFWRAANSGHKAYKNVRILERDNELLRQALLDNTQIPISRLSVKVERLIDRTPNGGFSLTQLKDVIISPFYKVHETRKVKNVSVCFVFEGFYIQVFMPGLMLKQRKKRGVINKSQRKLWVPFTHIFDIEEIMDLFVDAYGKHIEGKSKIKTQ